jgi:hypothetical protein
MKRLKGPELRMPELKVPPFLADLWWDLWDRRLLPLIALIVAAIVAVPVLMGGGSGEVTQSSLAALAAAGGGASAPASSADLTVVEAKPGLRDYRKRLARLSPTDPFAQRFAEPRITGHLGEIGSGGSTVTTTTTNTPGPASGGGGGESTGAGSSEPSPSGPPSTEPPEGEGEHGGGGAPSNGGGKPHLTFYTFAINVWVNRVGGQPAGAEGEQKPGGSVMKEVLPLTPLPGKDAPVVTYMGTSKQRKPLLLVSNGVTSMSGEAKCLAGETTCQLLEVEPGFPVTFVYGPEQVSYTIKVLKVELVVVKRT